MVGSSVEAISNLITAVAGVLEVFGVWDEAGEKVSLVLKAIEESIKGATAKIRAITLVIKLLGLQFQYVSDYFYHLSELLKGKETWQEFKTNVQNAKKDLEENAGKAIKEFKRDLEDTFNAQYHPHVDILATVSETVEIYVDEKWGKGKSGKFANGGFPTAGQLFIAREAGAEMVGTIGGSTAVANNEDIVSAVSQGVASAVASVLGGGTNVNVVLEGDANKLFRVVQSQARNYAIQTGSYAFG
jgi:hypothetical protein